MPSLELQLLSQLCVWVSRWAVFFVFPVFMTSVMIVKSVVLFKRGAVKDKNVSTHAHQPLDCSLRDI